MSILDINSYQTEVALPCFEARMGYTHPFMMMGSCFATNVGERLVRLKLPVMVNPFGVIYNPLSVASSIKKLVDGTPLTPDDLFEQNGVWNSYSHHSSFSAVDKEGCLAKINQAVASGAIMLRESSHLTITLGTSWAYRLKAIGEVVANCHKTKAAEFDRFFVEVNHSVEALSEAIAAARSINPALKVVLTVSPIRHVKDGLVENQRSKASLVVACHSLCAQLPGVSYFPSYEIVMDELRDYRFYAEDMVHPSSLAVDIIFKKFVHSAVNRLSVEAMEEVDRIVRAVEHIPFNAHGSEYRKFCASMAAKAEKLQQKYSFLDLTEELEFFSR
ncbi:GSCFA domain-containing protein [uncultured Acetobacteroides sp.]|uniref:GSCFA domain-containing protein n=1 Tax=uncultured Acetobacteroides sp. TaxID=1760811 RepID=UPI0029F538AF|nr:GSCFA domain-containing protein [uncultured Acetobacteroides sp.]